jgi:hypothetical protein
MPQFYFHLWRGGELTSDEVGVDLPTLNAAKRRAERIASSILDQNDGAPLDRSGWDIEVTDAGGRTFLIVPVNPEGLTAQPNRAA